MLIAFLVALVAAFCSTMLIHPWFWNYIRRLKHLGTTKSYRYVIFEQSTIALMNFLFTFLLLASGYVPYTIYGISITAIICLIMHLYYTNEYCWQFKGKYKQKVISISIVVVTVLYVLYTAAIISSIDKFSGEYEQGQKAVQLYLKDEFKEEIENGIKDFKDIQISYSNEKLIFEINDKDKGYGIFIPSENKFIACNYEPKQSLMLRKRYLFLNIKTPSIVISKEDVPYTKFQIIGNENIIGKAYVKGYILMDMVSGESNIYTTQNLPDFAK